MQAVKIHSPFPSSLVLPYLNFIMTSLRTMGGGNYLLNVVWGFWLYVRYLWGDVVVHLRFASSMKRCALGLITNSVTIPLVEGCSMGDTCTSQKSWKCLAMALKAPFVATTEPLSGCFYKGYKPSILLVLFYTPDVQTELFNVNEKEKNKQQCNLPRLLVENGFFFFLLLNIMVWTSTLQPGSYVWFL